MDRRTLLGRLAALATGTAIAGCASAGEVPVTAPDGPEELAATRTDVQFDGDDSDGRTPIPNPFESRGWNYEAGEDGQLVVTVTVENTASVPHTAPVRVTASTSGDEWTNEQFVTLEARTRKTLRFEFSVTYATFNTSDPSIRIEFPQRTPSTPVPETDTESDTVTSATAQSSPDSSDATRSAGTNSTVTPSETPTETG